MFSLQYLCKFSDNESITKLNQLQMSTIKLEQQQKQLFFIWVQSVIYNNCIYLSRLFHLTVILSSFFHCLLSSKSKKIGLITLSLCVNLSLFSYQVQWRNILKFTLLQPANQLRLICGSVFFQVYKLFLYGHLWHFYEWCNGLKFCVLDRPDWYTIEMSISSVQWSHTP